jgi:hypothetical protein
MTKDNSVPASKVRTVPAEVYDAGTRALCQRLGPLWPDEVPKPTGDRPVQIGDNVVLGYD